MRLVETCLAFLISLTLVEFTESVRLFDLISECYRDRLQCASNGVCGGGCAPPPPPPSCGCAGSYGCGRYGCHRVRAKGSKLFVPHRIGSSSSSKMDADRELLQQKLYEKRRSKLERSLEKVSETAASISRTQEGIPFDLNEAFYECCMDRQLPDACLQKCNYKSFSKEALTRMYFKQDACPLAAMSDMQFCAAMGRDHTECCARNGVSTTLAGSKCLLFCDQTPGRVTPLDLSYVPCFDRFEQMKACFRHELSNFYRLVIRR